VKQNQDRPGGGNRLISYGWLSVYYREAATAARFHAKDPDQRWQMLRDRVLLEVARLAHLHPSTITGILQ